MAKTHDEVRKAVSEAYAEAVRHQATGPGDCCSAGGPTPRGVTAKLAGYDAGELETLPPDALSNAFGCGNPVAFADVQAGEVVLDLGSGAGIDLLLAARRVGPTGRVIGVDMTDAMIERARANAVAAGFGDVIEVRKGVIEALPVEDASVDLLLSNCVINLSPEKDRVFAEIHRVLKPGGRMRVSDIVADELPPALREDARLYTCCIGGALPERDYVAGLEKAGLVDVRVEERIVYDAAQLAALIASEGGEGCCGTEVGPPAPEVLALLAGHVWSARVHARRA